MEMASRVVETSRAAPTSRGMAPTVFAPFITEPLCWHYSRKGLCPLGDACRFSHDAPSPPPTSSPSLLYWLHRMPNNEIEYSLLVNTLHSHGYRRAATPEEERRAALLW